MKKEGTHLKGGLYYDEEQVSYTPFFTKDLNKFRSIYGKKLADEFTEMDIEKYGVNMYFKIRYYYVLDNGKRKDVISLKYMKATVRGEEIIGGEWGSGYVLTGKSLKMLHNLNSPYKELIPEIF